MPHELADHFASLSDDALQARLRPGELTEEARAIALAELRARGLRPPPLQTDLPEESPYLGDMEILERGLSPQEAQLKTSFLRSRGIAAEAGDVNLVQTHSLLALAVGGASVRVPHDSRLEAQALLDACQRGEFDLGDDFQEPEAT